ncbi:tol-pal system protein YbgF [Achromobacter sp. F4_2707]|uniref:tol-pal system protein YbgF n=1 Tax=Achromobacter sp. F4_2707 TaxID=3114286 RepID=UPI0039C6203C
MSLNFPFFRSTVVAATLAASLFSAPVHAFADDQARRAILDLREQLQTLVEQSRQIRVQQADQIDILQQEVARLRGEVERLSHQSQRGQSAGAPNTGSSIQVSDPAEQAAFDQAMQNFRAGQYQAASKELTQFIQSYPQSALVHDARFYRGSSLYAIKDFKGSIAGLENMIKAAPANPRAPDALLVIAASQVELNDLQGARASLQRIVQEYPDTHAAETAKSRLQLL